MIRSSPLRPNSVPMVFRDFARLHVAVQNLQIASFVVEQKLESSELHVYTQAGTSLRVEDSKGFSDAFKVLHPKIST